MYRSGQDGYAEILQMLVSTQMPPHKLSTPIDYKQGGDVIITSAVSNEDAGRSILSIKTIKNSA